MIKKILTGVGMKVEITNQSIVKSVKQIREYVSQGIISDLHFEAAEAWITLNNGLKMQFIDKKNSSMPTLLTDGEYEKKLTDIVLNNLKDGDVFFDIGCNLGWFSLMAANKFKNIEIHSFEPVPDTVMDIKKNVEKNNFTSTIKINQLAIGDSNSPTFISADNYASNYVTDKKFENSIEVPGMTIDKYVRDNNVKNINFIKCDIEGHELSFVKGAIETLKKFQPMIALELIDKPSGQFEQRVVQPHTETIALLESIGYQYCLVDDEDNLKTPEDKTAVITNSFHNYIFFSKNLQKNDFCQKNR